MGKKRDSQSDSIILQRKDKVLELFEKNNLIIEKCIVVEEGEGYWRGIWQPL